MSCVLEPVAFVVVRSSLLDRSWLSCARVTYVVVSGTYGNCVWVRLWHGVDINRFCRDHVVQQHSLEWKGVSPRESLHVTQHQIIISPYKALLGARHCSSPTHESHSSILSLLHCFGSCLSFQRNTVHTPLRSVDLLFFFLPRGSNLSFERKELNSVRRAAASDTCCGDFKKNSTSGSSR